MKFSLAFSFVYAGNSPVVRDNTVTFDLAFGSPVTTVKCALLVGTKVQNETDCELQKMWT